VVGWLAGEPGSLSGALGVGTELWLLANGGGAQFGATSITVVPWGATAVFAVVLSQFARLAARRLPTRDRSAVGQVVGVMSLTYCAAVTVGSLASGHSDHVVQASATACGVAAVASAWGSARTLGYDPTARWPRWAQAVPRAVAAACLAMVVGGAAALASALVVRLDRVEQLTTALDPGVAGGIALVVVQLAFAPNLVIWASSYTLGAGFSLGGGSVVTPAESTLGLLPGIPVFGALPPPGAAADGQLWWLGVGVFAGGAAAWSLMRSRPAARFDEASLVGGLAGAVAGLIFAALSWASGGDLGSLRLAGAGPQLGALTVMAATTLGLSGMAVGLVCGLLRRRGTAVTAGTGAEPTASSAGAHPK
jgi:hypothetical protein